MKKIVVGLVVVAILFLGGAAWSGYNGLVSLDQAVRAQWGQVENAYQRRADLIPNLVVEGHTDSTGSRGVNEKLSLARAETVVEYLGLRGVEQARLTPRGFAYDQPVASNATADGRQKNRRVEIEIAPSPELRKQAAEEAQGPRASR